MTNAFIYWSDFDVAFKDQLPRAAHHGILILKKIPKEHGDIEKEHKGNEAPYAQNSEDAPISVLTFIPNLKSVLSTAASLKNEEKAPPPEPIHPAYSVHEPQPTPSRYAPQIYKQNDYPGYYKNKDNPPPNEPRPTGPHSNSPDSPIDGLSPADLKKLASLLKGVEHYPSYPDELGGDNFKGQNFEQGPYYDHDDLIESDSAPSPSEHFSVVNRAPSKSSTRPHKVHHHNSGKTHVRYSSRPNSHNRHTTTIKRKRPEKNGMLRYILGRPGPKKT